METSLTMFRRLVRVIPILFLLVTADAFPTLSAAAQQQATAAATPDAATPGIGTPAGTNGSPLTADVPPTEVSVAEQALADKYVPIAELKKQPEACSAVGEQYLPVSVEISLNDPEVKLRRAKRKGETSDPVIKVGPSAQDLVNTDSAYYLDLPGDSLNPGCDYEQWSAKRVKELGLTPSTYARVATQPSEPGLLALQYWFYWAFDDFNNTHESDWEMIQLTFDASTPEEALTKDPTLITFAQHAGGENADWDEGKALLGDGDHLVTFPASGSHADYYQSAIWIGWGAQGTGFGCDRIDGPTVLTRLHAIVIPRQIDPKGPFAWALFQGRWGEKHPWEFNGPLSPNVTRKWIEPVSWTDGLRTESLTIPNQQTFGVGPSAFLCSAAEMGGSVMKVIPNLSQVVASATIGFFVLLLLISFLTWRFVKRAAWMYVRYFYIFLFSSLLLLPVATLAGAIQQFLVDHPIEGFGLTLTTGSSLSGTLGLITQLFLVSLVAPGVIYATARISNKESVNFFTAVSRTVKDVLKVAGANLYNFLVVLLLTITIVGIPFAIYRAIQWAYSTHAVVLDGSTPRKARNVSRNVIKGDWVRTLGMAALVTYVAVLPGPIIGLILTLTNTVSLRMAGTISSLIFAVIYPITIIASTLYYLRRKEQHTERIAQGLVGGSAGEGFWLRVRHPITGGRGEQRQLPPADVPRSLPGDRVVHPG